MDSAITWAIGIGSGIFGLGMISAIASRRQRKKNRPVRFIAAEHRLDSTVKQDDHTGGMSMAEVGTGNLHVRHVRKDDFASISGGSR